MPNSSPLQQNQPQKNDAIDKLYRCCFWPYASRHHITDVVKGRCIFESIMLCAFMALYVLEYYFFRDTGLAYLFERKLIAYSVICTSSFAAITILLIGVHKRRYRLLVPAMINTILCALVFAVGAVVIGRILFCADDGVWNEPSLLPFVPSPRNQISGNIWIIVERSQTTAGIWNQTSTSAWNQTPAYEYHNSDLQRVKKYNAICEVCVLGPLLILNHCAFLIAIVKCYGELKKNQ